MRNTMYLVTGAAGFLGGTICRELILRGESVRAFVLPGDKAAKFIPDAAEICEGDLCDMESLERFFSVDENTDTIVLHIASIVTVNPDFNQKLIDVNVGGTNNIIDMCLKHKECKKLVYCSSTGAIPELPKGTPIKEVYDFDENLVVGCYSQSKALATKVVLDAVKKRGLNACVIHPSGILGPEDFAFGETTKTAIDIIKGAMPIGIAGSFNLCDVRDLAAGAIAAADKGKCGNCYILANEEVSFKDFSRILVEEAGCKKIKMFLPIKMAIFIAKILEKKAKKKGEKPLMTTFSVYNLARNNKFDSTKARKELGYTTRSYRETLCDEIAWLKREGKI
ncbi:MAG: NAD-dependent epimerase/dehydratase family protein [Oscillospiraceae bacterium]|nr:NAD-dependent epimerase/dehydratase family protein [Oscillospiraceae bacterium]